MKSNWKKTMTAVVIGISLSVQLGAGEPGEVTIPEMVEVNSRNTGRAEDGVGGYKPFAILPQGKIKSADISGNDVNFLAGGKASSKINDSGVIVSYKGPLTNEKEYFVKANCTVVDIEIRRVSVQDPKQALVFFLLQPFGVKGYGLFEGQLKEIAGLFWFDFNQTDIKTEKEMELSARVGNLFLARSLKVRVTRNIASETGAVIVYFPVEGVGLRFYKKTISEIYDKVTYNAPVTPQSKVIHLISSSSAIGTLTDPVSYSEEHKFSPIQEKFIPMVLSGGLGGGMSLSSDIWAAETPPIRAEARTSSIAYYDPSSGLSRVYGHIIKSSVSLLIK